MEGDNSVIGGVGGGGGGGGMEGRRGLPQCSATGMDLISLNELDPLGLRLPHHPRHTGISSPRNPGHDVVIQVALIAETSR